MNTTEISEGPRATTPGPSITHPATTPEGETYIMAQPDPIAAADLERVRAALDDAYTRLRAASRYEAARHLRLAISSLDDALLCLDGLAL
jgi:hypothetical protein